MSLRPLGTITRGTTHTNRLRRVDRWLADIHGSVLRSASDPLVIDLGFGSYAWTTRELADRMAQIREDVQVIGLEIDPVRVAAAQVHATPRLTFCHGGFELPPLQRRPVIVRAFNVLRQYDPSQVEAAWSTMSARLAPGGVLVEGTCDELGRHAWWVTLGSGDRPPSTLTLSTRLQGMRRPSDLADRLPKALIHRNVPGEPVHRLLSALDDSWAAAAPYASYGVRQRWIATVTELQQRGIPIVGGRSRWRLGELTVPWSVVDPEVAHVVK